jgi:hypothetical protein
MRSWKWVFEILVVFLLVVSIYHRVLGWLVGLIVRKSLGGKSVAPRSFNIHFDWIAVRLGLDMFEIVVDNFQFRNPPSANTKKYQVHENFVRIKQLRLSVCPHRLVEALVSGGTSIKIYEITVDGIEINLEKVDDHNVFNFQEALKPPARTENKKVDTSKKSGPVSGAGTIGGNDDGENSDKTANEGKDDADNESEGFVCPKIELSRLVIYDLVLRAKDMVSSGAGALLRVAGDNQLNTIRCPLFLMDRKELTSPPARSKGNRRPKDLDKLVECIAMKFVRVLLKTNGAVLSVLMLTAGFSSFLGLFQLLMRKLQPPKLSKASKDKLRLKKLEAKTKKLLSFKF